MKQQIKIWGTRAFAVILVAVAARYWGVPLLKQYVAPKKMEAYIPTAKVLKGTFTVSFHEIGTVEAERSVAVNSEIHGKIISIVEDGKVVAAGDRLAVLDTTELERELYNQTLEHENKLADVARAESDLELLKESNKTDLAQAQAQLSYDENELKLAKEDLAKKQKLLEERLIPGTQVDQAEGVVRSKELAVEKGKAQLALKEKEIESKETQKEADIRNAGFVADMAKSNLEQTERRMKSAVITAPGAGLVVMTKTWDGSSHRPLKEGDSVHQRQTICTLPDLTTMLVKVQVGESDAPKVRIDMPALIRLQAAPDKLFHSSVKGISNLATETRVWEGGTPGKKNFEVTVAVSESDPKAIKPGMTADVEFICDSIENAAYVPIESVVERGGKTYVFVKDGKQYERTPVKTGKYNDNFIVVTSGLKKDQVVALRDPTRELDLQEAGSVAPGAEKKKQSVPIPGAD